MNRKNIERLTAEVDENRLHELLEKIVGERHRETTPKHLEAVRGLIRGTFRETGLHVEEQHVEEGSVYGTNIIGKQAAEGSALLISAHYDSVKGSPGADDNASALAALLEAVRILGQQEWPVPLWFVAFDLEEEKLAGSKVFAAQLEEGAVKAVLNLEMIGYASEKTNSQQLPPGLDQLFPEAVAGLAQTGQRGNFLAAIGNEASAGLLQQAAAAINHHVPDLPLVPLLVPGNGEAAEVLRRSDHAPFWDRGIPALMLTDTSEFRNPHYHSASDTLETLNMPFLKKNTQALVATVVWLLRGDEN